MVKLLIILIRIYQRFISPFTPGVCRFSPTCSEYAVQSLSKYGILKGSYKAVKRIAKCHPLHPGGYDPV